MRYFQPKTIWAYPTDTSWGLGVRADDAPTLQRLAELKDRSAEQFFSLMVRDWEMLQQFAHVGEFLTADFFSLPRTAILPARESLPKSKFWPSTAVAWRVCQRADVAAQIDYPITATSANKHGEPSLFDPAEISAIFPEVKIFSAEKLPVCSASEIWDFTQDPPQRRR